MSRSQRGASKKMRLKGLTTSGQEMTLVSLAPAIPHHHPYAIKKEQNVPQYFLYPGRVPRVKLVTGVTTSLDLAATAPAPKAMSAARTATALSTSSTRPTRPDSSDITRKSRMSR